MSDHPRLGERVHVRPRTSAPVQRAEGMYGQFLAPEGQEALWDDYLHRRWAEGAIEWRPLSAPVKDSPKEPAPAPEPVADKENG